MADRRAAGSHAGSCARVAAKLQSSFWGLALLHQVGGLHDLSWHVLGEVVTPCTLPEMLNSISRGIHTDGGAFAAAFCALAVIYVGWGGLEARRRVFEAQLSPSDLQGAVRFPHNLGSHCLSSVVLLLLPV